MKPLAYQPTANDCETGSLPQSVQQCVMMRLRSVLLPACLAAGLLGAVAGPAHADTASGLAQFQAGRFAEAVQAWHDAAAGGDADAALYLGALNDTGLGVAQDFGQALSWYKRAADAGSVIGMFDTGVMYDAGRGAAADPSLAAAWYGKAAAKGFGRAEYNLAMMQETGAGVPANRDQAVRLYRAAAGHGVDAARAKLRRLGQPYAAEVHREPGTVRGADENGMAAFQQAQRALLSRDPASASVAAGLFRQAALQGNPLAQYDLAYCYEHGIGLPVDQSEAVRWYRLSASQAPNGAMKEIAEAGMRNALAHVTQVQR